MGWLWSSGAAPQGSAAAPSDNTNTNTNTNTETQSQIQSPKQSNPPPGSTPDEQELAKFFAQIQAEFGGSSSSSASTSTSNTTSAPPSKPEPNENTSTSSSITSWLPSWPTIPSTDPSTSTTPQTAQPTTLDPLSESLLPTSMSCRHAFDQAFYCNSLGGQWTSVYRSGTVRSCSEQWDDFWFCMRTRAYSGPVKEEAIKDYYRQKELAKYGAGQPNSTDIWEARTERLPEGSMFAEKYVKPDISDDEWYREEIARTSEIRRLLREEEEREEAGKKG
ncbi:hypothetical protein F4808DRAFT_444659 [Astrocystis sublimbata]|nr:hypothetical protein F4808DRAFT_444659 [Astrocystis sublimbata]